MCVYIYFVPVFVFVIKLLLQNVLEGPGAPGLARPAYVLLELAHELDVLKGVDLELG